MDSDKGKTVGQVSEDTGLSSVPIEGEETSSIDTPEQTSERRSENVPESELLEPPEGTSKAQDSLALPSDSTSLEQTVAKRPELSDVDPSSQQHTHTGPQVQVTLPTGDSHSDTPESGSESKTEDAQLTTKLPVPSGTKPMKLHVERPVEPSTSSQQPTPAGPDVQVSLPTKDSSSDTPQSRSDGSGDKKAEDAQLMAKLPVPSGTTPIEQNVERPPEPSTSAHPTGPEVQAAPSTTESSSDTSELRSAGSSDSTAEAAPLSSRLGVPSSANVVRPPEPSSSSQQRIPNGQEVQGTSDTPETRPNGISDSKAEPVPLLSRLGVPSGSTAMTQNVERPRDSAVKSSNGTLSTLESPSLGPEVQSSSDTPEPPSSDSSRRRDPTVEPSDTLSSSYIQLQRPSLTEFLSPTEDTSIDASSLPWDSSSLTKVSQHPPGSTSEHQSPQRLWTEPAPSTSHPDTMDAVNTPTVSSSVSPAEPTPARLDEPSDARTGEPSETDKGRSEDFEASAEEPNEDSEAIPGSFPEVAEARQEVQSVKLHLSGQCGSLPSFQSDCLKACTWMLAVNRNWEITNQELNLDSFYPRVEIGNETLPNTYDLFTKLTDRLNLNNLDNGLTLEQRLLSNFLGSTVEDYLGGEHREWYRTKRRELLQAYEIDLRRCWATWRFSRFTPRTVLEYIFGKSASPKQWPERILRATHSTDILSALDQLLDDKRFFFYNDRVTTLDVRVFAVLMPILEIHRDVPFQLRDEIKKEHSKLVDFTVAMKNEIYPGNTWTSLCSPEGEHGRDRRDPAEIRIARPRFSFGRLCREHDEPDEPGEAVE